jgi:hypothetical protein
LNGNKIGAFLEVAVTKGRAGSLRNSIGATVCWPGASDTGCLPVHPIAIIENNELVMVEGGYEALFRLMDQEGEALDALGNVLGEAIDDLRNAAEDLGKDEL